MIKQRVNEYLIKKKKGLMNITHNDIINDETKDNSDQNAWYK